MRDILDKRAPGYVATASELETRFVELLEAAGVEVPEKQVNLGGDEWIGRVDFVDRRARVVFELDGRVGHASELDRKRDRRRDNELMAEGFRVFRFTWEELVARPQWVLAMVRKALTSAA